MIALTLLKIFWSGDVVRFMVRLLYTLFILPIAIVELFTIDLSLLLVCIFHSELTVKDFINYFKYP